MPSPAAILLPARSSADWLATHLVHHLDAHAEDAHAADGPQAGPAEWLRPEDLGGPRLTALHAHHLTDGATPQAAAKWLCGWFAGGIADPVGFTLAMASAALVGPRLQWRLHPGAYPERSRLDVAGVVVAAGHPWSGQEGVTTVPDEEAVRAVALRTVVDTAGPVVERCRGLAKVGRATLWAEVADALGLAVVHRVTLAVHPDAVERLRALLAAADAPWRASPTLQIADTETGPAYLGQKGGCCLAYQCADPEGGSEGTPDEADQEHAEHEQYLVGYRERFPEVEGAPAYCSTCSLRETDDALDRHRFWVECERRRLTTTT